MARAAGWLGPWLALGALALWTSEPDTAALAVAAAGASAAAIWGVRGRGTAWGLGSALLILAILTGFVAERQVDDLLAHWEERWSERENEVGELLGAELERIQAAGEAAADALATRAASVDEEWPDAAYLRSLRERHGSSALALYDGEGVPLLWDGVHWGKVPEEVQAGTLRHAYQDRPLFGYLYVTAVAPGGMVAVAAYLLRADLPEALGADVDDLASRLLSEAGERIRITQEDPGTAEAVWDLALPDRRLLSVVLERPEAATRATRVLDRWRVAVSVLVGAAWLLLAVGAAPRVAAAASAASGLLLLAAWLPLEEVDRLRNLFDPAFFTLPGPVPLTLGRLALVLLAGFTLIAVVPRPRLRLPSAVAGVLAGLAFPPLLLWLHAGAGPTALASGRLEWVVYEVVAAALLTLVVGALLAMTRPGSGSRTEAALAVGLALVLGAGVALWVRFTAELPWWWPLLWAVPIGMAAAAARAWHGWQRPLIGWALAALLAGSVGVPVAWAHRVQARMLQATERLGELASADDPELASGLLRLGAAADSLDRAGRPEVDLLYSAWLSSGLAEGGHPVRLTAWRADGLRGEELRAGVEAEPPDILASVLLRGRAAGEMRLFRLGRDDARYVLTVPLSGGRMMTVVAPTFVESSSPSSLGPFVRGPGPSEIDAVSFIPVPPDEAGPPEPLRWVRTPSGWQAEILLSFTNNRAYHVHYAVDLPGVALALARATLLLVLGLTLFAAFWLVGRGLLREVVRPDMRLSKLVLSFRARVTLALFGFFALANAVFGTAAYRTLAQASHRSARVTAERVVEDAARWNRALGGGMERLSRQVGAELLEYRQGELRDGSVEELVELGLYEAWAPFEVHQLLDRREGVRASSETRIGQWEYVTSFRRMPDGDILAAQVPLQAGTAAIQAADLIELLGFVILLGAALSLGLAMMASRALTRPIQALLVASERVGSGNLRLSLPEERADEFGSVFKAFNRMVGRVRRARRQLVRTSRRTQLIMEEAAVGMVALDPAGRVTLVNPRAEELLGAQVKIGHPIPLEGPLGEELTRWIDGYQAGTDDELDTELQAGERRVRLRARRLGSLGTRRGAVVSMDDVTDELRAERVLAWGEMARQVAHEVKNPLTPIKLSIQHVRRAWQDQRPDFDEILVRNADAMLREIDRLAAIARSFSRFGAPGGGGQAPLAEVSVEDVVNDVMALYEGASGPVRFEHRVEGDLPCVVARASELKEVLVNLLENARLAVQDGGLVCVRATPAPGRDAVLLQVVDDGSGIAEDILPRIFEPQFSTRSTGTGLGLAIVQRLVHGWGGDVAVQSAVERGTTVSVRLRAWVAKEEQQGAGTHLPETPS